MTGSTVRETRADSIRASLERNVKAVSLRPSIGQGTAVSRVRLRDGVACEVEDGPWKLIADMSEKYGGERAGPDPGVYGRAALGACAAIGYALWAARRGIPIEELEVEVQADFDVRGELGVDDAVPPSYLEIRLVVTVRSSAPEAEVRALLDEADAHSSWLTNLRRPVPVVRETNILAGR